MPKQISRDTVQAVAVALRELYSAQGRPFAVVLHGGEPLILGAARLRYVVSTLRAALPSECAVSLQTNGMLISNEILDLCSDNRVTVSVSLDGPQQIHDRNRIDHKNKGTFIKVLQGLERLRSHPDSDFLFSGLLAVIDPHSNPTDVYSFFKSLKPPSVDFIYRDGNHTRLPYGKKSLHSTEYGQWMAALVDVYLADRSPIRIRIVDDTIKLLLGGLPVKITQLNTESCSNRTRVLPLGSYKYRGDEWRSLVDPKPS